MTASYVIDAVRTPRGRGKPGKGALSGIHPQELFAQLLVELARRNGWRIVSTEGEDGEPRDVGEVGTEVWSAVEPLLR